MRKFKLIYTGNIYELWVTNFEGKWSKSEVYSVEKVSNYGWQKIDERLLWSIESLIKAGYEFIGIDIVL